MTLQSDQLGDVPCTSGFRASDKGLLPMSLDDYLDLLGWTARALRAEQGGAIPGGWPAILERLPGRLAIVEAGRIRLRPA